MNEQTTVPFCKAPWHSISLAPTGKIGPCCLIPFGFGDLNLGDTLLSAWQGDAIKNFRKSLLDGNLAPGCLECKAKDADGFTSMKSIFDRIAAIGPSKAVYTVDAEFDQIYHLDISLSNKCNLKCRFCYSGNSTAWFRDRDQLLLEDRDLYQDSLGLTDKVIDVPATEIEPLIKNLKNLQQIEFKGGEPFMSQEHIPFLKMLIEHDVAKDVDILYTANGTIFDPEIFSIWKQFRGISLTVSVDGTGAIYQYVRGGRLTLEENVLPNLRRCQEEKLANLSLNLHYTVCTYNLLEIPKFLKWHKDSKLKCSVSFGLVDTPQYLSIRILPRNIIDQAIASMEPYSQDRNVSGLISALKSLTLATELKILRKQFFNYTESLDRLRKTSLPVAIPDLIPYYDFLKNELAPSPPAI